MSEPIEVECPCCRALERDGDGEARRVDLREVPIFQCNACGARVVFGEVQMRVVVEPLVDSSGRLWVLRRYQDPRTKRDVFRVKQDPRLAYDEAGAVTTLLVEQVFK